jgi:two-component system NtrC family sensor kinase
MTEPVSLSLDAPILQALLDLLPGTLHVKDRAHRYCMVNRRYLERWGGTAEEVIGRTSAEAYGDLFGPEPDRRNAEVFASGRALPFYEVTYPDPQGGSIILWATKVPIRDEGGAVTHVLTFSLDITPLKRMQQQLDESEQLRSAIAQHSLECFITADEDGRIVEFNPAAEQVFGYTRAEALGKPIGNLLHTTRRRRAGASDAADRRSRALLERSGERFETLGSRADGSVIPIEVSLVAIPLRERRLFTACVRDLSERQRSQAQLERQRQELQHSERLSVLGTLAAGISHELRNPLSVVVSQAKLLEDELIADGPRARVSSIVRAADRCAAIVRAFLDQSRSGPRKVEQFDLGQIVDAALHLATHVLREHNVALDMDRFQPSMSVQGDPHQLSQVVLNLLLNAAGAMKEQDAPREIRIGTALNATRDAVELTVSDTGPGIPPELRERIFDRFFTTKPVGAGTGLGLAICRDIVSAHGGSIKAEVAPEGGAAFRVRLPLARGVARPEPSVPEAASRVPSYRVLVVDDESEVAELLREILEIAGHAVDVADSGESALQRLSAAAYDLVLSDMRMPGINGAMLYETICAQHPQLAHRFAVITGDALSDSARFLQRTRIPHLSKPFEPRQVRELVALLGSGTGADTRQGKA